MPNERNRGNKAKSIDRWNDEGGAPSGGDRSARREAAEREPSPRKKTPGRWTKMPIRPKKVR